VSPVHVVVVGHGMVGARFAEEVRRHDPDGRRVRLTILAAEPRPAYNRVLLPSLLSGVMREEDFAVAAVAGLPVAGGREPGAGPHGNVLPPDASVALRVSARVTGIDPVAKTVLVETAAPAMRPLPSTRDRARPGAGASSTGLAGAGAGAAERIGYDVLVLATGARPVIPPLPGVLAEGTGTAAPAASGQPIQPAARPARPGQHPASAAGSNGSSAFRSQPGNAGTSAGTGEAPARSVSAGLSPDVAVLHSLEDARRIAAFAQAARRTGGRVAVLGGGVLGLEAARALAARGTDVTVVHRGGHLMDRQLDAPAGRVLAGAMRRTGVELALGAGAAWWESGRGLWLADGQLVRASGLILCTGTAPCTELARDAGLRLTESGSVAVDDTLATSGPGIYAIGDCAGHPGAAGGLVQPGWEQAAVLASRLTGTAPKAGYRGSGSVTRLKAAGIELTALGPPAAGDADGPDRANPAKELEVLRFEDPVRERYAKLVLSADRVVGAVLIGLPDAAAGIVQLYDRDAPAPADRLALLLGRALPPDAAGGTGPGALPDYAVVCRCNMVTKGQLRDAWYRGACGRAALAAATRAATGCGTCGDEVDAVASWLAETDPSQAGAPGADGGRRARSEARPPGGPESGQPADPPRADPQQKEAALR
jgi:assimilatory nitrate reductase electron transfer subunit